MEQGQKSRRMPVKGRAKSNKGCLVKAIKVEQSQTPSSNVE